VFVGAGLGFEWFRSRVFVLRWSMFVGIVFCVGVCYFSVVVCKSILLLFFEGSFGV